MMALQKEAITQLTKEGIRSMIERRSKQIVIQILELEKYPKKDPTTTDKFKYQFFSLRVEFLC